MIRSRIASRFFVNVGLHFFNACLVYYFANSLGHGLYEPRFVANDSVVNDLSVKYNFSIFDFHQAKKEAHLKHLRAELLNENRLQINP